jgi:hypothetical protein
MESIDLEVVERDLLLIASLYIRREEADHLAPQATTILYVIESCY